MRILPIAAVLLFSTAPLCLADATVEEKSQVHFSGALGSVINTFSRGAREGVTSTTVISGNRRLTRSGDSGEIVDLDQEKVYTVDFERHSYTVKTFADLRREWQEQQERAKKRTSKDTNKDTKTEKSEGPEYEVDFDVKNTGKKETINGWSTRQEVVTVAVHEKGRKIEQSGGFVLTSDLWMGPKVAAMRDLGDFDRRFAQKIYGSGFNTDMRQMAMAVAMTPAFGKAMKAFSDKSASFDGTPIRTNMKFETVGGTDRPKESEKTADNDSTPTSVSGAVIGGLFNRMKQRQQEKKAEAGEDTNRSQIFDSTSELLKATASATAADVAIPSGFRQR